MTHVNCLKGAPYVANHVIKHVIGPSTVTAHLLRVQVIGTLITASDASQTLIAGMAHAQAAISNVTSYGLANHRTPHAIQASTQSDFRMETVATMRPPNNIQRALVTQMPNVACSIAKTDKRRL